MHCITVLWQGILGMLYLIIGIQTKFCTCDESVLTALRVVQRVVQRGVWHCTRIEHYLRVKVPLFVSDGHDAISSYVNVRTLHLGTPQPSYCNPSCFSQLYPARVR